MTASGRFAAHSKQLCKRKGGKKAETDREGERGREGGRGG